MLRHHVHGAVGGMTFEGEVAADIQHATDLRMQPDHAGFEADVGAQSAEGIAEIATEVQRACRQISTQVIHA